MVFQQLQVHLKNHMKFKINKHLKQSIHKQQMPSTDMIGDGSNLPTIDDQEHLINSDDDDEQGQMPVDDAQTECNNLAKKNVLYL